MRNGPQGGNIADAKDMHHGDRRASIRSPADAYGCHADRRQARERALPEDGPRARPRHHGLGNRPRVEVYVHGTEPRRPSCRSPIPWLGKSGPVGRSIARRPPAPSGAPLLPIASASAVAEPKPRPGGKPAPRRSQPDRRVERPRRLPRPSWFSRPSRSRRSGPARASRRAHHPAPGLGAPRSRRRASSCSSSTSWCTRRSAGTFTAGARRAGAPAAPGRGVPARRSVRRRR